jgi:hypothetical protein
VGSVQSVKSIGPNVRKLIIHKVSLDAVPSGGGIADAIGFLSSADNIRNGFHSAQVWVQQCLDAVRSATNNPFKDDEEIAKAILDQIEQRQKDRSK